MAFVTAIAQVLLALYNKRSNFIFGAISVCLYVYIFFTGKLYAESLLNIYYLIASVIGWWQWKNVSATTQIAKANRQEQKYTLLIALSSLVFLYFVLKNFTDSTVPLWDAAVSCLAWAGTYLLTRKRLACWLWLSASNIIAIPLLYTKAYVLIALLTMLFLILGVAAWVKWRREINGGSV